MGDLSWNNPIEEDNIIPTSLLVVKPLPQLFKLQGLQNLGPPLWPTNAISFLLKKNLGVSAVALGHIETKRKNLPFSPCLQLIKIVLL